MRTDIYMHKGVPEDKTPLSPASPNTNTTQSPSISLRGGVMLGYSAVAARQSYRLLTDQIKASGNESLAMGMANTSKLVTDLGLVVGTKGLALIPMAISGAIEVTGNYFDRERSNREREVENMLRGARLTQGLGFNG